MTAASPASDWGAAAVSRRLADYVVLSTAPEVPLAAADYWDLSAELYLLVRTFVETCVAADGRASDPAADRAAARAYGTLLRRPADPAAHRSLDAELARLLQRRSDLRRRAAALVADADPQIWIDYWLGESYPADSRDTGLDWLSLLPVPERRAGSDPRVAIIVPFRDTERGQRLRNLIACLHALADQDFPGHARVIVVETDIEPRCRDLIEPLADCYRYGYKDGGFNKSWAVNLGLRAAGGPGDPGTPDLTCVLDADILVERSFVACNVARFAEPGHSAHQPFRWSLSLDGPATDHAIWQRIGQRAGGVGPSALRGLLLREPPGGCLWARTEILHRIGGFDERFEGWGGEDDDVTARLRGIVPLTRFDDQLLHLDHPRPQMIGPDGLAMNECLLTGQTDADRWTGAAGFGDPGRFLPAAASLPAPADVATSAAR